jgi:hypothetical protein
MVLLPLHKLNIEEVIFCIRTGMRLEKSLNNLAQIRKLSLNV